MDVVCSMIDCFTTHYLDEQHTLLEGALPLKLQLSAYQFQDLWNLHPDAFDEIMMYGRPVKTPRWQQAFGADYHFSGQTSTALPVPLLLRPLLEWSQSAIDSRLNGLFLNWYDGSLGHYIGKHRDSVVNMVEGAPIVTVSFGETRTLRLRPHKGRGFTDFDAKAASAVEQLIGGADDSSSAAAWSSRLTATSPRGVGFVR